MAPIATAADAEIVMSDTHVSLPLYLEIGPTDLESPSPMKVLEGEHLEDAIDDVLKVFVFYFQAYSHN